MSRRPFGTSDPSGRLPAAPDAWLPDALAWYLQQRVPRMPRLGPLALYPQNDVAPYPGHSMFNPQIAPPQGGRVRQAYDDIPDPQPVNPTALAYGNAQMGERWAAAAEASSRQMGPQPYGPVPNDALNATLNFDPGQYGVPTVSRTAALLAGFGNIGSPAASAGSTAASAAPTNSGQPSGPAMANTRGATGPVALMDMYKLPRELQRQLIEQRAKELQAQQEYEHAQTMQAQTAMQGAQNKYEQAAQAPTDRMSPGSELVGRLFGNISQALDPRMGGQQVAEGAIGQQNQNLKENQHKRLLIMEAQAQRLAERYDRLGQVEEAHKWAGQAEKAAMQRERITNEANWNSDNAKMQMEERRWQVQQQQYTDEQKLRADEIARKEADTKYQRETGTLNDLITSYQAEIDKLRPHVDGKGKVVDPDRTRRVQLQTTLDDLRKQRQAYGAVSGQATATTAPRPTGYSDRHARRDALAKFSNGVLPEEILNDPELLQTDGRAQPVGTELARLYKAKEFIAKELAGTSHLQGHLDRFNFAAFGPLRERLRAAGISVTDEELRIVGTAAYNEWHQYQ